MLGLIAACALGYAGSRLYNDWFRSQTREPVTIRFYYMQDENDDGLPNWFVDSTAEKGLQNERFVGRNMLMYYKGKLLDDQLTQEDWREITHHRFYITGIVEKTYSGKYRFIASKYRLIKDKHSDHLKQE